MPFQIVRNDITKMTVDAIVNAANESLAEGGGVCGAIFAAAGSEKLTAACQSIGRCDVGKAVMTPGFDLPAGFIIHTVGPVWKGGGFGEAQLLRNCYTNSLILAENHSFSSIAFPLISSGIYGYPKDQALQIAIASIGDFLLKHDMTVYLVVFDGKSFALSEKLFSSIKNYIDENYIDEHTYRRSMNLKSYDLQNRPETDASPQIQYMIQYSSAPSPKDKRSLEDVVKQLDESFTQMLLRLIDEKGTTDVDTYKRANMDRKLFSKIRSAKKYTPSKITAIAFAIALELSLDEAKDLLGKAGYTLSRSTIFDVIIRYFIEEGNYNIFEINEALFAFGQPMLGA